MHKKYELAILPGGLKIKEIANKQLTFHVSQNNQSNSLTLLIAFLSRLVRMIERHNLVTVKCFL